MRLIDANEFLEALGWADADVCEAYADCYCDWGFSRNVIEDLVQKQPTVDAVEVSRLGKLGRLMMPYKGCPRGRRGEPGYIDGEMRRIIELDAIEDVEGDRWIPVLEGDLRYLKARANNAVEVVHGEWTMVIDENDCECIECPLCGEQFYDGDNDTFDKPYNYCPNCGAKMDGDGNG